MTFDENKVEQTPDDAAAKPVAFCQNCGKPLDEQTVRVVGPAVYCEPCLAAKLGGAPTGSTVPGSGPTTGGPTWQWTSHANWIPPTGPNPGLAGLLGVIPGVGAMYNEQYAKGIFHLIVFAVLISLSHASDLFGLFAFGWVCYMVIEAHHTARARRDGTVLPNPFGLNDLGERLGFGRAWPGASVPPAAAATAAGAPVYPSPPPADSAANPYTAPDYAGTGYVPPATPWGASTEAFDREGARAAAEQQHAYWTKFGSQFGSSYGSNYGQTTPPVPPAPPYGMPYAPIPPVGVADVPFAPKPSRFPVGAVWLIGLGTIFLLSTTGVFQTLFGWSLVGFVLIGLAVWIFLRRMMDTGAPFGNDGSAAYSLRVVRALWPSVWVFAVGVLLLLNEFDIVQWHRSWPLFIILAGVMGLLQRAASSSAASAYAANPYGAPVAPQPAATAAAAGNPYSIVSTMREPLAPTEDERDTRSHEGDR